jgi:hypothetical protein
MGQHWGLLHSLTDSGVALCTLQILVEALGSGSAASRLTDPSTAARVQRKRLFLLFKCASCCPCAAAALLCNPIAPGTYVAE